MAATATARTARTARTAAPARRVSTPSRRTTSPTRRPAPTKRRRSAAPKKHTPVTGFVPVAAAAGAVSGIADSGIFVWLTRGRLWIVLLGTLLVGIVGLNVLALGFSASSSNAAGEAEDLARQNSALRAKIATTLSSEQVQTTATDLGLAVPEPGAIRYVKPAPGDAASAAKRLRDGDFTVGAYVDPAATTPAVTDPTAIDPAAATATTATTDPAATATADPATADPATTVAPAAATTDPAATTATPPATTDPAATAATPATPTATGAVTP